jgi:hypothetical protein
MDAEAGSLLLMDEVTSELYFDVAHGEKSVAVREVRFGFGQEISLPSYGRQNRLSVL